MLFNTLLIVYGIVTVTIIHRVSKNVSEFLIEVLGKNFWK